jgi:hypothetical protein
MARRLTESEKEEVIDYMRNMRAPEGNSYVDAGDRMLMDQSIYRTLPLIEENFERLPIEFQDRVIRGGMERRARAEQQFMGASGGQLVSPNIRSGGLLSPNMPSIDFGIDEYARAQSEAVQRDMGVEPTVPISSNQVTTMPPPFLQNKSNEGIFGEILGAMSGVAGKIAEKRGFTEPKTSPQSANQMIPTQVGATPINASNTLPNAPTSINNFPQRQNVGTVGPFDSNNRNIMEVYDPNMDYTKYLPNTAAGSPMPSGGRVDPSLTQQIPSSGPATFAPDQTATTASIAPSVDTSFGDANQLGFKQDGALGMQGDASQLAKLEYPEAEIEEDLKEIINPAANVDYKRLAKALALGFNTLRLNPDQQLASYLGKSLEEDRKRKLQGKTLGTVVDYLENKGYKDHANIARKNPDLAMDIYKQVVQQEMSAKASPKVSGVQYDANDNAFVVVSEGNTTEVRQLGIKGRSQEDIYSAKLEAERLQQDLKTSADLSNDVVASAYSLESKLVGYRKALAAIKTGEAKSGYIQNTFLPAFNAETSALRQAANNLGITVINSATFGALSETELRLALSTELDLSLPIEELEKQVIAKIEAAEKFKAELMRKAYELRSMPYSEYVEKQAMIAKENEQYLRMPDDPDITVSDWAMLNAQERKQYYLLADQEGK